MEHYSSFFGLKENPFVLTPDPKYLYLGHKHREVMSHLLYGINEDKGFMVIVGEVGTGKTTLCRAFINQLMKENIEVGLIYNPAMTDLELLQAINREFKLDSNVDTKSGLVDALNEFLLKVNGEGRKVVLIIDEAQNLDPSVMEQIRLISNLETETRKLIQIILVGQPELERTLAKEEMRQLDQRVVVRGLLGPLRPKETINYLRHRLKVAGIENGEGAVTFTEGACKNVHKRSGGIPRLINVLADRALLVAYTQGKKTVDRKIVKSAHKDLERSRYRSGTGTVNLRWQTVAVFSFLVILLLGWFLGDVVYLTGWRVENPKPVRATTFTPPKKPPPKPAATAAVTPPSVAPPVIKEVKEKREEETPEQILDRF
ncbi:MAG: AAA family ATPase, partial [Deltaproteobacteria bacterium]|nr:AAA family ATPase [Deltaproteobacteria bacterium]